MNERDLLQFLSRLVRQQIGLFDHPWNDEKVDELAVRLARGSWDGLILLLREGLAAGERIQIAGLGSFQRMAQGYRFEPAASLAQAGAMSLPAAEGNLELANRTQYLLVELEKVIALLPPGTQLILPETTVSPEEALLHAIFGPEKNLDLGQSLRAVASRLTRVADRLTPITEREARPLRMSREREFKGRVRRRRGQETPTSAPISAFDLSVRTLNCLGRMKVETLGDLSRKTEEELLEFKEFGRSSLKEVKDLLEQHGMSLGAAYEGETG